jgi:hypothetical protein
MVNTPTPRTPQPKRRRANLKRKPNTNAQRRPKRRRGAQAPRLASGSPLGLSSRMQQAVNNPVIQQYYQCLESPFTCPPAKLSMGTLVPTFIQTLYYRGSFNLNADGSGYVALFPSVAVSGLGPLIYNYGAHNSSGTYQANNWTNATNASALATECRVIACGLRATPLLAATTIPGVANTGNIPGLSPNALVTMSTDQVNGLIQERPRPGVMNETLESHSFPVDTQSFIFYTALMGGWIGSTTLPNSCPVIGFQGYPNATSIYVEAVLHIECLTGTKLGTIINYDNVAEASSARDALSGFVPSWDSLMETVGYLKRNPAVRTTLGHATRAAGQHMQSLFSTYTVDALRRGGGELVIADMD